MHTFCSDRPSTLPKPGDWKYNYQPYTPTAKNTKTNYLHWTLSNQLSFNRTFGEHKVDAVAVYEAEMRSTATSVITGTGTAGDDKITTTFGKNVAPGDAYNNNNDGKITGVGTHDELMKSNVEYKEIYDSQMESANAKEAV